MNVKEIYNLILSSNAEAKDLLKKLSEKIPLNEHKYLYIRCLYKSVSKNQKFFPEYEKILLILFDENTEYTVEFVNYVNQLLKILCFLRFYKEYYKIISIVTESNLPNEIEAVSVFFRDSIKNNLYICTKDEETAKNSQQIMFNFTNLVLNKFKDFELIAVSTLQSKHFLYILKIFQTSKQFFDFINIKNIKIPADRPAFIKELSKMTNMILQFVDFDSAKVFIDLLHSNDVLRTQYELILYRKTLNSTDDTIEACMKITSKFISEKKSIISTQMMIIASIIDQSLISFSNKSCEQIVNMFIAVLQNIKFASSEYHYFTTCCKSFCQHICVNVFISTLKLLIFYFKANPNQELNEDFEDNINQIAEYFLQVIKKFECQSFKHDLKMIYETFFEISKVATSESCVKFSINLFKDIFNAEKCQNKMYAPEEVRSFIILCSKIKTDSTSTLEEMNALYVGHLLNGNNSKEKIREKITKYYKDTTPTSTILEVIERNESHRKPTNFDVEILRREERDVCVKWFKHMIPKLAIDASNDLDYVLVVMQDEDIVDHDRLEHIYTKVLKELCEQKLDNEIKAEKYLTLAYTTQIEVLWKIHLLKDLVKIKYGLQENEFIEEMEILSPQLSVVCLSKETTLIEKARESLRYFVKFHSICSSSSPFKKLHIDWDQISGYVNHLSRIFHARGYVKDKIITMKLLYKITEMSKNDVTYIQALSFFLEMSNSNYYEFDNIIEKQIPMLEDILFEKYMSLESLKSPRTENTVLLCMLNLAFYFYLKNNLEMTYNLLEIVKDAIDFKLPNQIGKCNVIRMYFHITRYRIQAKAKDYSLEGSSSLHKEVETIWNCFKTAAYISSEDSIIFPTLQMDILNELFVYHSLRLTTNKMVPYVRLLLTHGFSNGCPLRIIQIASIYSHVHYESECMTKFTAMVKIIENVICKTLLPKDETSSAKIKISPEQLPLKKQPMDVIDLTNDEVSLTVRRDVKKNQFVKKIFIPNDTSFSVEAFVEEISKYSPEIQSCLFNVIVLYVKLLSDNGTLNTDIYFKKLYEFRKSIKADEYPRSHMIFFIMYINFLRQKSYKLNSIKMMTDRAARHFKEQSHRLDSDFELNISTQYFCSQ